MARRAHREDEAVNEATGEEACCGRMGAAFEVGAVTMAHIAEARYCGAVTGAQNF